jgi:uncharacterized protein (TIGR03437 family)
MGRKPGWALLALCLSIGAGAQTLTNQSLTGKYFFRHISLGVDTRGTVTDPRSIIGTITFDGVGHYAFSGQQLKGANSVAPISGSGAYSVDPAGVVAIDNPQRSGTQINGRLGVEALIGATTEPADSIFDLFVAIPAPASAQPLIGPYFVSTLEFSNGSGAGVRNSFFVMNMKALGSIDPFTVYGHAANLSTGQLGYQNLSGSYSMTNDGSGTAFFGPYTLQALLSGNRTLYESADGNVLLGGSPSLHDILIAVKAPATGINNASWSGNFWSVGLRYDPTARTPDVSAFSGSLAARVPGLVTLSRRTKALSGGTYDFTGVNNYALANAGGVQQLLQIGIGASGKAVIASSVSPQDPGAYEIDFTVQMPSLSGPGVFLNPQGITSAASFFPPGAPIAPGEFVALFGTGLATGTQVAAPPYPAALNGISVLINGAPAPIRSVSATQINCLVPYGTAGATATIVVQNGSATSNAVTVPLAQTMPSIFTLDQSGIGAGAILHADYTPVTTSSPATTGETVLIFLTGMGSVTPPVADGTAGGANPLSTTDATPTVLIASEKSTVLFSGLAPGFPGLYQMNVTLPPFFPATGLLPLAIQTGNAFNDQADIAVK